MFNGDETKYELWEVEFFGYLRLQKLYDVIVLGDEAPEAKSAELVQCLDDRSLSLVIRDAKNYGQKALGILRGHSEGK